MEHGPPAGRPASTPVGNNVPPAGALASPVVVTVVNGFISASGGTAKQRGRAVKAQLQENPQWQRMQRAPQPSPAPAPAAEGGQPAATAPAASDVCMGGKPGQETDDRNAQIKALEAKIKIFESDPDWYQELMERNIYFNKLEAYTKQLAEFRTQRFGSKPIAERVRIASQRQKDNEQKQKRQTIALDNLGKQHEALVEKHRIAIEASEKQRHEQRKALETTVIEGAKLQEEILKLLFEQTHPSPADNGNALARAVGPTPTHDGHAFAAPISVTVEAADHMQAVLNDMRWSGKIPVLVVQAFEFAVNKCFIKPPGAQPPALGGQAMPAGGDEGEAEAAAAAARAAEAAAAAASAAEAAAAVAKATADARSTATVVAGKENGKGAADPY